MLKGLDFRAPVHAPSISDDESFLHLARVVKSFGTHITNIHMNKSSLLLTGFFTALASSAVAGTSAPTPPPMPPAQERDYNFQIDARGDYDFLDSTDDGPSGDIWRTKINLPFALPVSDSVTILGSLTGQYTDYETSPFDDDGLKTWNWSAILGVNVKLNDTWDLSFAGFGNSGHEEGADYDDSYTYGGIAMVGYRWSPTLWTSVGAIYYHRLNDDNVVLPIIQVDWKISDDVHFDIKGLETHLTFKLSEQWSIYARGEIDPNGARIDDRRGSDAYTFSDTSGRVGLGIKWSPNSHFSIGIDGGGVYHDLEVNDEDGDELSSGSPDIAPYVGVSVTARF